MNYCYTVNLYFITIVNLFYIYQFKHLKNFCNVRETGIIVFQHWNICNIYSSVILSLIIPLLVFLVSYLSLFFMCFPYILNNF